jgi:c(7)-type cytochrome triheme protein
MMPSYAKAMDRAELGRVLKMIPEDGPPEEYGNVVYRRLAKKKGMAPVVFQHWSHRARYTCRVCHLELEFSMRKGASQISRDKYLKGKFCGACHNGKLAFSAAESAGECDRCHVENKAALKEMFERFVTGMPETETGNKIDWANALATGKIKPKNTVFSEEISLQLPEKIAQPMKLGDAGSRSVVTFSHSEHFAEMDCSNCHPDIFNIKKKGTERFSMDRNLYGVFCGSCHMRVAFPMSDCRRCHPGMRNIKGV